MLAISRVDGALPPSLPGGPQLRVVCGMATETGWERRSCCERIALHWLPANYAKTRSWPLLREGLVARNGGRSSLRITLPTPYSYANQHPSSRYGGRQGGAPSAQTPEQPASSLGTTRARHLRPHPATHLLRLNRAKRRGWGSRGSIPEAEGWAASDPPPSRPRFARSYSKGLITHDSLLMTHDSLLMTHEGGSG
jgi:hypothetical protein